MAANGYQGQIAAINYTYQENSNVKTGFQANTDIYALIEEDLSPTVKAQNSHYALTHLGIQTDPGIDFQLLNYSPGAEKKYVNIVIGETGVYEINDVRIIGLKILEAAEDVIIDYVVEEV